jgi:hypothetical protein
MINYTLKRRYFFQISEISNHSSGLLAHRPFEFEALFPIGSSLPIQAGTDVFRTRGGWEILHPTRPNGTRLSRLVEDFEWWFVAAEMLEI